MRYPSSLMPDSTISDANRLDHPSSPMRETPGDKARTALALASTVPVSFRGDSFATRFCRHFGVPAARFDAEVLRRTLYPHVRWLQRIAPYAWFGADRGYISCVGRLTRRHDFDAESEEFQHDIRQANVLRRFGRFRVSVGRMRRILDAIWPEPIAG